MGMGKMNECSKGVGWRAWDGVDRGRLLRVE